MAKYRVTRLLVSLLISYIVVVSFYGILHHNTWQFQRADIFSSNDSKTYDEYDHLRIVSNCLMRSNDVTFHKYSLSAVVGNEIILLYGPGNWDIITKSIEDWGYFEQYIDNVIYFFMRTNPSAVFVDIGGNIGIRSLQVAKYGREAIAIEALRQNVVHFCRSIYANGLSDKITLLHNAIAEDHRRVKMAKDKMSMGCSFVIKGKDDNKGGKYEDGVFEEEIPTITFDDLLKLDRIKEARKVFIKMDIEGYEAHALQEAEMFFRRIDVIGVMMEWRWHRGKPRGAWIIDFMKRFGFIPFWPNLAGNMFRLLSEEKVWPDDILWLSWRYLQQIHIV